MYETMIKPELKRAHFEWVLLMAGDASDGYAKQWCHSRSTCGLHYVGGCCRIDYDDRHAVVTRA